MKNTLYILIFVACSGNSTSIKNVEDELGFTAALDECKAEGKDAGLYSVYEKCAQKADIKYNRKNGIK